jgi:hypothetical protein
VRYPRCYYWARGGAVGWGRHAVRGLAGGENWGSNTEASSVGCVPAAIAGSQIVCISRMIDFLDFPVEALMDCSRSRRCCLSGDLLITTITLHAGLLDPLEGGTHVHKTELHHPTPPDQSFIGKPYVFPANQICNVTSLLFASLLCTCPSLHPGVPTIQTA